VPEENLLLDFMVQEEISEADTPTIRLNANPSGLISDQPPSSPILRRMPFLPQPALFILAMLWTGTTHAGLHTQWLG